ncbi:MAG: PAS domain S-box protein, partial [Sedimentisphaerales bacterium]|nr:PAS domain S-box protein [Sedimentisphaerales bacterium]
MNRDRKIIEQVNRPSKKHRRVAGSVKSSLLLLWAVSAALVYPVWQGWTSLSNMRAREIQLQQALNQQHIIVCHDEVLTLSAKMAATTGDTMWADHYEKFGPRPKPAINDHWSMTEKETFGADVILTIMAHDKLIAIEKEVFEHVAQGHQDLAAELLQRPEYQDQKLAYNRGMQSFLAGVQTLLKNRQDKDRQILHKSGPTIGIILLAFAFVWLVSRKLGGRSYVRVKTKRKKSTYAHEWQETFNAITDSVCIIDKDSGKIMQCNKAMTQFLGRSNDEIIGQSCCELLHGSSKPIKKCPLVRMYETRRSETTDFQVGDRWLSIKADPYIDDEGNLIGAVHILSDITEQRKADKALKESENKFRLAFANAQDAIIWIDGETGAVTNCNKATEELFRRKRKEIIGQHHTRFYPEEKAEEYHRLIGESRQYSNSNMEAEILTRTGEIRIVTIAVSTMTVEGSRIVQGIMRDITESKRAIQEIENLAKFPSEDPNPV